VAGESTKPKKRLITQTQTVREKLANTPNQSQANPRRLQKGTRILAKPFRPVGRFFARIGNTKVMRIIGLVLFPPYFRNSYRELRQVTWPTLRNSLKLTLAVVIFSVIFGLLVTVVDYGLGKLFKEVLLK
jgi:preprotein translocase SecE subunit